MVAPLEFNTRRNPSREGQHFHAMEFTVVIIILAVVTMPLVLIDVLRPSASSGLMKATLY